MLTGLAHLICMSLTKNKQHPRANKLVLFLRKAKDRLFLNYASDVANKVGDTGIIAKAQKA